MNQEIFGLTYSEELYQLPIPVTVVLNKPWSQVTEAEHVLLSKILGSVKQSLNAVTIVEMETVRPPAFAAGTRVLCFGSALEPAAAFYQAHHLEDSVFIQADTLSVLEPDATKKKELWAAMKQAFL